MRIRDIMGHVFQNRGHFGAPNEVIRYSGDKSLKYATVPYNARRLVVSSENIKGENAACTKRVGTWWLRVPYTLFKTTPLKVLNKSKLHLSFDQARWNMRK